MSRPLMTLGISQLETMFVSSTENLSQLKILLSELLFRSTPKAKALQSKVKKAIDVLNGDDLFESPKANAPCQEEVKLPTIDAPTRTTENLGPISFSTNEITTLPPQKTPILKQAAAPKTKQNIILNAGSTPPTELGLEQAYAFYKIKFNERWDVIEQLRRDIVDRSSPNAMIDLNEKERSARGSEAKLANAAALVILRGRCNN